MPVSTHGTMKFASRQTFLISPEGKVVKVWPKVDPNVHSTEVLAEIESAEEVSISNRRKKARALN